MMEVTVHLFGHYKDARADAFVVSLPDSAVVSDLARQVASSDSKLIGLDKICRAAVNEEYAGNAQVLQHGDTIAFIPPMSGG